MSLSIADWHRRYQQQAKWTQNIRDYIYKRVGIQHAQKILDVGCGTGILTHEIKKQYSARIIGLDIDFAALEVAYEYAPGAAYTLGDCHALPYSNGAFDITLCHFLLLWVADAFKAIVEMVRVTRPGGFVLALAEPDYGGRIDFPPELARLGTWQTEALRQQGANPLIGRELRSIFSRACLGCVEVGLLGGNWQESNHEQDLELEWDVIRSDLSANVEFLQVADKLKALDRASHQGLQRILYVPTFYAIGRVMQ